MSLITEVPVHKMITDTKPGYCVQAMFPSLPTVNNYNEKIMTANDLLILRQFDECLSLCREQASAARNFSEDETSVEALQSFVLIAIQAYAELNRWQEVIPFVTQIYNGLEDCPVEIAKLCIQLHLQLGDRATCAVVATIWLRHPANFTKQRGYCELIDLYMVQVLVPGALWDDARLFLNNGCLGLDDTTRDSYMRKIQTAKRAHELKSADWIEVLESSAQDDNQILRRTTITDSDQSLVDRFQLYIDRVKRFIIKHIPVAYMFVLRNICVAAVVIYFLYTRWLSGHLSVLSPTFTRLFIILRRLWKGMFAPFHDVNR